VSGLESSIDDLYRLPLAEFTASRRALAKTLSGAEAKRVRSLPKPTAAPWAVNQVYWNARATYDRLIERGEELRQAQIRTLKGRGGDVRAAAEAHRQAVTDAVRTAQRLAAAAGAHPPLDALMRTFEALSLMPERPSPPGRLTDTLQPAGFEALAGVPVRQAAAHEPHAVASRGAARAADQEPDEPRSRGAHPLRRTSGASVVDIHRHREADRPTARERERERARQRAEARTRAAAANAQRIAERKGEAALARAEAAAKLARAAVERAERHVATARAHLEQLRAHRSPPGDTRSLT
jgi:hypothetical protein